MESIVNAYKYIDEDLASPLTKDWFLVSSIWPIISIILAYNIFSRKLGPYLMRNREPYDLTNIIKLYNIFQVIISSYLVYEGYHFYFHKDFNGLCQGLDPLDSPRAKKVAELIYIYFSLKFIELLDTVFFVLRKSFRQVSPLHLHHHSLMPFVSWIAIKYIPGGQCVLIGWVNSFVHVIMYGYYYIAGLGPEYKKFLWWKKYVTLLQLAQFSLITIHSSISLFYPCSYPFFFKVLTICYGFVFINMFGKFYYQSYIKEQPKNGKENGVHQKRHLESKRK